MTIYLAGPLFSEAKQNWHRATKSRIESETTHKVIWPFDLFSETEIASWGNDAPVKVMERCRDVLAECDMVVALLDGPQVDDGTAWEIGYAHAKSIPVVGIRTDFRKVGDVPGAIVNAMVHGSCLFIVRTVEELITSLPVSK